ncbi:MAG: tetratricopeptide repeat protein [Trebonia sp.]
MQRELVAETYARCADGSFACGSGYLIAPGLVLTAAHTVVIDGVPAAEVTVRFLRDTAKFSGRVAWWCCDGPVDAALVEIAGSPETVSVVPPVRWGRLTGTRGGVRCEAIGFPRAHRGPDEKRDSEDLTGTINPGTRVKARQHDVLVDNWPEHDERVSAWSGISGAAVFCDALLTGILVVAPSAFASRRLTAVPVAEFLGHPGFSALVGQHAPESVELADLFERDRSAGRPQSPAYLLRADAEVVPFHGRAQLLKDLSEWCDATDSVSAWLVTGPGGQGKTRLARKLATGRRDDGWVVGWLRADDGHPADFAPLAESAVPLLVIVDYAETRTGQLERLLGAVCAIPAGGPRVRLLLLARSAGAWWPQVIYSSDVIERTLGRHKTGLPSLEITRAGRAALFTTAAERFAEALRRPGQAPVPLPPPPSGLGQPRYDSVLTVHMSALVALLQAGPDSLAEGGGDHVEELLLRHEERYWRKAAATRGLRFAYSNALPRAVAVATLFAADTEEEAARLLGLMPGLRDQPEERRLALAEWLHDLYPAPDRHFWGRLQPDRLGEHLIAGVTADSTDLFDGLFTQLPRYDTLYAFEVLSRASPLRPAIADMIARLITQRPELAPAVVAAAISSEHPDPLVRAIDPLIGQLAEEPAWLQELLAVTWAAPVLFGSWNVRAERVLTDRYRDLAREDPATHRPELAAHLFEQAERHNVVGDTAAALALAEEAAELRRTLPGGPDRELGTALGLLAGLYSHTGRTTKAVEVGREAAYLFDRLDPPDPHGTVQAWSNLSKFIKEDGNLSGSLQAAEHALNVYHQVPEPDAWLTVIATSAATNKANRLIDFGDHEAGLAMHREIVDTRRRIVRDLPVLFDGDHASGLFNLAKTLARMGHAHEALPYLEESIDVYRQLAGRIPDVYRTWLADTLIFQGGLLLGQPGQTVAAAKSLVEAELIATAIDDRPSKADAAAGLREVKRHYPWVKKHLYEFRRQWASAGRPPDSGEPSDADSPGSLNTDRNQPKRQSRHDRKDN